MEIQLEAVLLRVDVVASRSRPFGQEQPWGEASKAIVVGDESQKWETTREDLGTKTRITADVACPGLPRVIRVGAIASQ